MSTVEPQDQADYHRVLFGHAIDKMPTEQALNEIQQMIDYLRTKSKFAEDRKDLRYGEVHSLCSDKSSAGGGTEGVRLQNSENTEIPPVESVSVEEPQKTSAPESGSSQIVP